MWKCKTLSMQLLRQPSLYSKTTSGSNAVCVTNVWCWHGFNCQGGLTYAELDLPKGEQSGPGNVLRSQAKRKSSTLMSRLGLEKARYPVSLCVLLYWCVCHQRLVLSRVSSMLTLISVNQLTEKTPLSRRKVIGQLHTHWSSSSQSKWECVSQN